MSDFRRPQILGIVNITRDSFSDGGRYLAPDAALAHARQLRAGGADIVDLGAESTHPDAEDVPADDEIARLTPLVRALRSDGTPISIDTYKPAAIRAMLALGVDYINDVTALRDPAAVAALRDADARVILMHSTAPQARAARHDVSADTIVARIVEFFGRRIAVLESAGLARERLILDPGMGFFLSRDPAPSLAVLRHLDRLRTFGLPLCVSTSRKSFIGTLLGTASEPRPAADRAAGTLATELWAALQRVDFIRTHDPRSLNDVLTIWQAIAAPSQPD